MINEIFKLYFERKEWFLELLLQHIHISINVIVIAGILGMILGIFISEYKKFAPFVIGVTNIVYTIPSISLLGFLIPFFGIGDKTAIIALIVYALLPIVRNTYTGINTIDNEIIEAAKGMGSTKIQILVKIKFPLAVPVILAGLRNMVVMVIAMTGIASFIGAGGLGVAIYRGITTNNSSITYAGSILIAMLALICDFILGLIEKHFKKKRRININEKKI